MCRNFQRIKHGITTTHSNTSEKASKHARNSTLTWQCNSKTHKAAYCARTLTHSNNNEYYYLIRVNHFPYSRISYNCHTRTHTTIRHKRTTQTHIEPHRLLSFLLSILSHRAHIITNITSEVRAPFCIYFFFRCCCCRFVVFRSIFLLHTKFAQIHRFWLLFGIFAI